MPVTALVCVSDSARLCNLISRMLATCLPAVASFSAQLDTRLDFIGMKTARKKTSAIRNMRKSDTQVSWRALQREEGGGGECIVDAIHLIADALH
jgi:hypothetical protein